MTITDIKIRKLITEGKLKAIVSITIDECFVIHDIKIIQGEERLFIAMPSRKDETGMFRDIAHPIDPCLRQAMEDQIVDAYKRYIETFTDTNYVDYDNCMV